MRRGRSSAFALAEYVNDRPYVASSFLSVALVTVFKTAIQATDDAPWPFEAAVPVVRGSEELVRRLFEPLGYEVSVTASDRYVSLRVAATLRLSALLTHLYVLLPVLDDEKHYWVDEAELEKLRRRGEGWLDAHPERELIARRYLKHDRRLYAEFVSPREEALEERVSLRDHRLGAVQAVLKASGARRVVDLECGPGALLERLVRDGYDAVTGVDVSPRALEIAARRVRGGVLLLQSPLTYRDKRLRGHDAGALVEVIEHLDPPRLAALEANVFGSAGLSTVVVTTPNAEYNRMWETLPAGAFRHPDHRFEFTRAGFSAWASRVASSHGYTVRFLPVGPEDADVGAPTQMAVFSR